MVPGVRFCHVLLRLDCISGGVFVASDLGGYSLFLHGVYTVREIVYDDETRELVEFFLCLRKYIPSYFLRICCYCFSCARVNRRQIPSSKVETEIEKSKQLANKLRMNQVRLQLSIPSIITSIKLVLPLPPIAPHPPTTSRALSLISTKPMYHNT